jgi:hypothetical protein
VVLDPGVGLVGLRHGRIQGGLRGGCAEKVVCGVLRLVVVLALAVIGSGRASVGDAAGRGGDVVGCRSRSGVWAAIP